MSAEVRSAIVLDMKEQPDGQSLTGVGKWLKKWLEAEAKEASEGCLHPGRVAPPRIVQRVTLPGRIVHQINGHQIRVDATQDLAALDIDLSAITQAGGWKSTRMPLQLRNLRWRGRRRSQGGIRHDRIGRGKQTTGLRMTRQPLTAQEYEAQIFATDRKSDKGSDVLPLLGLIGETGSLLSEVKKKQRDSLSYAGYADAVLEELGDVLWYVSTYARRKGMSLATILDRLANGPPPAGRRLAPIPLSHFQHPRLPLPDIPTPSFERTLLELASSVGGLVSAHLGDQAEELSTLERLERTMSLLIKAADEAGVTIEAAARNNIHKTTDRWPAERVFPTLLDAGDNPSERLHRHLQIDIDESEVAGKTYVFQRCNGINIGDRLTDNAPVRDDYRFHDVFHYAYAAVIGWSPVVRSLFRLKRKSRPDIDEGEDSARPALIEEGIAAWIFNESTRLKHFEGLGPGDLPFGLLKRVREFVTPYEVGRCPLWVWEEAILQGFSVFRYLREHRRGRLVMDLEQRRLSVEPLPR